MDTNDGISTKQYLHLLPSATRKALNFFSNEEWLKKSDWYLAGGTALAIMAGHRVSVDLDFFTQQKDFSEEKLINNFSGKAWKTDILRKATVYGKLLGAKVSFIAYPFFVPHKPFRWYGAVRVLDPHDVAVMKIIAISQRGRKRDFVDLFWYCTHQGNLLDVMRCLPSQYPTVAHNYTHILKSLAYFDDADAEPMPKTFFKTEWPAIKRFFQSEVPRVTREVLRLD